MNPPANPRDVSDGGVRAARVNECVRAVVARRSSGDGVSDDDVVRAHPELMPELAERLAALRAVEGARRRAHAGLSYPVPLAVDALPGYQLVRELHRGGQGIVYRAVQKSTHREVAVKVTREGPFGSAADQARFEREVRILAQLNHPNIVTIFDSGVAAGHFYYVMRLIEGLPVTQWLIDHPCGVRETLAVFVQICDAVTAAHLKGVIHRDLKPGNLLVDADGTPFVLDFGLAKLSESVVDDSSMAGEMTQAGQFVGSLPWAAPEQAAGRPDLIDVRTDVYALGVVLYQLLSGRFPYPTSGGLRDVLDNILTAEPHPLTAVRAAGARSVRWSRLLRFGARRPGVASVDDDVETIVRKCLAKDPAQRYQGAADLARDVRHYLAHEPIEAKRDSGWYVLRKTLRRHRVAVAIVAGFLVLTSLASAGLAVLYRQQCIERERAEAQRNKADRVADFMEQMLHGVSPLRALGRDATMLLEIADVAAQRIDQGEMRDAPEAELRLRLTLGHVYRQLGQLERSAALLQPCIAQATQLHGRFSAERGKALLEQAVLCRNLGEDVRSAELAGEALEIHRASLGDRHPRTAICKTVVADWYMLRGEPYAAERLFTEAAEALHNDPEHLLEYLQTLRGLANAANDRGDQSAVERLIEQAHAAGAATFASVLALREIQADLFEQRGQFARAEALLLQELDDVRAAWGPNSLQPNHIRHQLGRLYRAQGRLDLAEQTFREEIAALETRPGASLQVSRLKRDLGNLLSEKRQFAAAGTLLDEALAIQRRLFPEAHPEVACTVADIGALRYARRDLPGAESAYREAWSLYQRQLGADDLRTVTTELLLAEVLLEQHRTEEAERQIRHALDIRRRVLGDEHPDTLRACGDMAWLHRERQEYAQAKPYALDCLEGRRRQFGTNHPLTQRALDQTVTMLFEARDWPAAEPLLCAEAANREQAYPPGDPRTLSVLVAYGRCLRELHEFAGAESVYRRASESLAEAPNPELGARIARGQVELYSAWHAAEPDEGHDAQAAEWREKLAEWQATTRPSAMPP